MEIAKNITMFIKNFDLFIDKVSTLYSDDEHKEYLKIIKDEPKNKKWDRGTNMVLLLNKNNENFLMFCESKIKVFSNKNDITKEISSSLLGDVLLLKSIFNNRTSDIKCILWMYLHRMAYTIEKSQKNVNMDRTTLLDNTITTNTESFEKCLKEQKKDAKTLIKDIFGVEVNNSTNNMLDDIMSSFENSLNGNNGNPLNGILDISKKISSKYQDKIMNGDIELNKLVGGLQSKLPNMIPGMEGLFKDGLGGSTKKEPETIIIDENFSTDNVELGNIEEKQSGMNIGKMLNMANSLGVLGGKGSGPNIMDMFGGNGLSGIMDMFKNMNTTDGSGFDLEGIMKNFNMNDISGFDLAGMMKNFNMNDVSGFDLEAIMKNFQDSSGNINIPNNNMSGLSEMFKNMNNGNLMDMLKNFIPESTPSCALDEMNTILPLDDEMVSIIEQQKN